MPIYEYFCQGCENKFEIKASLSEKEKGLKVNCPSCGSNKTFQILGNFFTPLESPAIYSGVDSKNLVVSRSKIVNPAGQRAKFERGLKPRSNFLTEFTFSKGRGSDFSGGCGPNPTPGCCG